MPTVLLQEIRDLLTAFLTAINQKIEAALDKLNNIDTNVDAIADDDADIKTTNASIDNKLTTTNSELDTLNGKMDTNNAYLGDIKTNTGAVITPISQIKLNTDTIVANTNQIAADAHQVQLDTAVIAINTGKAAEYDEDTATNTLNIYNKVLTIASDTTQMRADNQEIIDILNQIYDKL